MDDNTKFALFTALGIVGKSVFDFLRGQSENAAVRESKLWLKLGELEQQCTDMRKRITALEAELNAEKVENTRLKNEVDDERGFQGKPPKYAGT